MDGEQYYNDEDLINDYMEEDFEEPPVDYDDAYMVEVEQNYDSAPDKQKSGEGATGDDTPGLLNSDEPNQVERNEEISEYDDAPMPFITTETKNSSTRENQLYTFERYDTSMNCSHIFSIRKYREWTLILLINLRQRTHNTTTFLSPHIQVQWKCRMENCSEIFHPRCDGSNRMEET
jgi:hypothetical protein